MNFTSENSAPIIMIILHYAYKLKVCHSLKELKLQKMAQSLILLLQSALATCIVQIADKNHHLTPWNSNIPLSLQNCIRGGEEGYIEGVYCV